MKRKHYLLLTAAMLLLSLNMKAQSLLLGDANQDGKLSVADVTKSVNMILGKEVQDNINLTALAYTVYNKALVGTWYLGETAVTFRADGTTDYPGAVTYEFRPVQGTLTLKDEAGKRIKIMHVTELDGNTLVVLENASPIVYTEHAWVDLGLPSGTLWATCNIGAENPEDYGFYFAWGETTGYTDDVNDGRVFDQNNYKHCDESGSSLTKYCNNTSYGVNGFVDNKLELDVSDDAAYVNWGREWRMPSYEQIEELLSDAYTTCVWTTQNGVFGRKITGKYNGNSIFLPAAGYRQETSFDNAGKRGGYWSCSLYLNDPYNAYNLTTSSTDKSVYFKSRWHGLSIRPVRVSQK